MSPFFSGCEDVNFWIMTHWKPTWALMVQGFATQKVHPLRCTLRPHLALEARFTLRCRPQVRPWRTRATMIGSPECWFCVKWKMWYCKFLSFQIKQSDNETLLPIIMVQVKNGRISNRIITFQICRHFPLNHDSGRKSGKNNHYGSSNYLHNPPHKFGFNSRPY